ncbi:hypothetical protein F4677DRAFT_459555 [Hypoxylon crocopeplum]|nr:hypothetical protein F4677DRAFT_459555 [Hypoxylon crocopeplum]
MSQQPLQWTVDGQQSFQHMAADSGDEACTAEDIYDEHFMGRSTPYARAQTTAVGVSAENVGRDFGPSHPQHKTELVESDMYLPNLRAVPDYTRGYETNYDPRQLPWQAYNTMGSNQAMNYLDFPHGLPDNWNADLTVFAEPPGGTQVSPSSISSSDPSSATSEAVTAMDIDTMTGYGNTVGSVGGNSSASVSDSSGNTWTPNCPSTVSPKLLRIQPSPTPTSSSESIHTNMFASGDSDLGSSAMEYHHARSPFPSQRPSHRPRKELPSKPAKPRHVPMASSGSSSSKGKRPVSVSQSASLQQPSYSTKASQPKQPSQEDMSNGDEGSPAHDHGLGITEGGRSAKDDFLVRSKLAGMTYREIREKGHFTEAESTLRGRFRTLTKDKEARVRKPEWQDNDIRLLKKAVRKLNKGSQSKAPWGSVADYISSHGGSYHFGSATCHRKWKELVEEGTAGLK